MENNNTTKPNNLHEFHKLLKDFVRDLLNTFPEYKEKIGNEMMYLYQTDINSDAEEENKKCTTLLSKVYEYCGTIFPERFFDILYKNENIFTKDNDTNTMFYPNVDFKDLWSEDISDKTKEVLWKYLQLTLFTVVNSMDNVSNFGDTAKLFEAINEDELQKKVAETFEGFSSMFNIDSSGVNLDGLDLSGNKEFAEHLEKMTEGLSEEFKNMANENDKKFETPNMEEFVNNMPNPEELQDHIKTMLDGKLGRLAQDIAAETAADMDFTDSEDVGNVFEKMVKNPAKLLNLVKTIGTKIDEKIKSGELKESELMCEATELMNKMKNMPGMGDMESMMNKMAGSMMGKGAKFNMNAFNQKSKASNQRERMLQELEKRRAQKMQEELEATNKVVEADNNEKELSFTKFKTENSKPAEKSTLEQKPTNETKAKKKRKNKKHK